MKDLVTRLRRWSHDASAAPASDLMDEAADAIERASLTHAEREALTWFTGGRGPVCPQHLATIRNLMDRL
jgi:hypothetical protein